MECLLRPSPAAAGEGMGVRGIKRKILDNLVDRVINLGWEEFAELWDIQAACVGYALGVPNSERQYLNNCIAKENRSWQPE
jgi:hypothetical protein